MSENEIKEVDKDDIDRIATILKSLFNMANINTDSNSIYDEINLNYHYKCFTSKNLEKRLKGITYISKEVENCLINRNSK